MLTKHRPCVLLRTEVRCSHVQICTDLKQLLIIVDNTDAQGRSSFRVVISGTTFDIASVLKSVDSDIAITNSSKYRVEIAPMTITRVSTSLIVPIVIGLVAVLLVIVSVAMLSRIIGE